MEKILGIDIGIASVGYGLIQFNDEEQNGSIIARGVRIFDKAEVPKTGASLALPRRDKRGQRRLHKRKKSRLKGLLRLMEKYGLDTTTVCPTQGEAYKHPLDIWALRLQGTRELLTGQEFASVLYHIAKHRGFQSNAKVDKSADIEQAKELKGMKAGMESLQKGQKDKQLPTVGAYLATCDKRRNSNEDYSHLVKRDDLRHEVDFLFQKQNELGNTHTSTSFKDEFIKRAFDQRPLKSSIDMVGFCTFFDGVSMSPKEKRAPKKSPSAELFVALGRLRSLTIKGKGQYFGTPLSLEQLKILYGLMYKYKAVTFKRARKELGITPQEIFNLARYIRTVKKGEPQTWEDIVDKAEKTTLVSLEGYHELKKELTEKFGEITWQNLQETPDVLDSFAKVLTFYRGEKEIKEQVSLEGLDEKYLPFLLEHGGWDKTIDLCLRAVRLLNPLMVQGMRYDEACQHLGWHHSQKSKGTASLVPPFKDVRNPVVNRAMAQSRKVINAIIRHHGMPDKIHIELARDLGRNFSDRRKITKENEERAKRTTSARLHAAELFGYTDPGDLSGEQFKKYRLWKEQEGFCLYSGVYIEPSSLGDPQATEIDHALPYSRSFNNSWSNMVLCFSNENRKKQNQTPYEYLESNPTRWKQYETAVMHLYGRKNNNKAKMLLTEDFEKIKGDFKQRALNDTRYTARALKNHLEENLISPREGKQFIFVRPGQLTAKLRSLWGLSKTRDNHLHHATDALVVASATQSVTQKANIWSRHEQRELKKGEEGFYPPKPWETFREDTIKAVNSIFVSHMPRRGTLGPLHNETIRSLRYEDNNNKDAFYTVQRTPLKNIKKMEDLDLLVDIEVYASPPLDGTPFVACGENYITGRNRFLYQVLFNRLESHGGDTKQAFATPVYMKAILGKVAPVINAVHLKTKNKSGIKVHGGLADNGAIVRIDIFKGDGTKGAKGFFVVPVYTHHMAQGLLPDKAIVAGKPEREWLLMDAHYIFQFSLYPKDYVCLTDKNGEVFEGYYTGVDRTTGAISLVRHDGRPYGKSPNLRKGVKGMAKVEKLSISILGEKNRVGLEQRQFLANKRENGG